MRYPGKRSRIISTFIPWTIPSIEGDRFREQRCLRQLEDTFNRSSQSLLLPGSGIYPDVPEMSCELKSVIKGSPQILASTRVNTKIGKKIDRWIGMQEALGVHIPHEIYSISDKLEATQIFARADLVKLENSNASLANECHKIIDPNIVLPESRTTTNEKCIVVIIHDEVGWLPIMRYDLVRNLSFVSTNNWGTKYEIDVGAFDDGIIKISVSEARRSLMNNV